jgi:methionyl-tRNA formyltransferase
MRIVYMGTPEFSVPSLDMLVKEGYDVVSVVTQPDKPKGRGRKMSQSPVKTFAIANNIGVLQPQKIRTAEFLTALREFAPDLIVTAAYGKLLPEDILRLPSQGCINVHASLLPKYRGAAPIHRAVINGERKTGITVMFMDKGMDTGDILKINEIEIDENMTSGQLHDLLAPLGAITLKETLESIKNGTLVRTKQNNEEASYAPMIEKSEGEINWQNSARDIHNLVRGMDPWPCAFTYLKDKRMKVLKTCVTNVNNTPVYECRGVLPGKILNISRDGMQVLCGKGTITITDIQFDSCRGMCMEECWHNFDEGEKLGKED